jgi:outer membrane lipoprotein LolB
MLRIFAGPTRWVWALPGLLGLVWLTGCTTPPPARSDAGSHLAVGAGQAYFSLSGRLSIRDGQRIEIATLRWERTSSEESLTLGSPLGTTVARLWAGQDGIARLKTADREASAANLEALTADALGTPVPLQALGWWIQGLDGRTGGASRSPTGSLFTHEGWDISIEEFPLSSTAPVARRIVARRGEVTLRLVIDAWEPRA